MTFAVPLGAVRRHKDGAMTLESLDQVENALATPGLSLAYLDGDQIVGRAWGAASRGTGDAMTPDTRLKAASISKPVTAYAALQLARQGILDIDADVNDLLKQWRVPRIGDWQPVVTTRMLLAHVSGLDIRMQDRMPADEPVKDVDDALQAGHCLFFSPPGLSYGYSGGGYLVVAELIREATGETFADAVRELVFEPLGMRASTFVQPPKGRVAHGHVGGIPIAGGWYNSRNAPATGMWTTPSDLMRFARAVNDLRAPEMLRGHPIEPRMGLGLFLTSEGGIDWWSHGGNTDGFESMLVGTTSGGQGFAAAVMVNGPDDRFLNFDVLRAVSKQHGPAAAVIRHVVWDSRGAWARMTAHNKQAVGEYRLPGDCIVRLESVPAAWGQSEVALHLPGQPGVQLLRVTDGWWRIPGLESYLVYEPPDTIRFVPSEVRGQRVGA
jgi:CubicO group peptidase (beta-lactamase class C family)